MGGIDLERMVGRNERIIWKGVPDKKCFILESIFNPMLPFALIWAIVDFGILGRAMFGGMGGAGAFIIPFMLLHLMPVWMYICGILFSIRKHRNTKYIVTDRGIYVSGGVFTVNVEMKPFAEISHIKIHQGIIDQYIGVGDVITESAGFSSSTQSSTYRYGKRSVQGRGVSICDIPDFQGVYNIIKDLQTDVYADTMYPNDYRPPENHGYNTNYTKH